MTELGHKLLLLLLLCLLFTTLVWADESDDPDSQSTPASVVLTEDLPEYPEAWPSEELPEGIDPLDEYIHSHFALRAVEGYFHGLNFLKRDANLIPATDTLLAPFLEKLMELRSGRRKQVTLFQFGGSHIKPGWFAGATEKEFNRWLAESAEEGFSPTLKFHYKGINGASFRNQLNNQEIFDLCRNLKPDLIVISMGTNDAQGTYSATRFRTAIDNFMTKLYKYSGDSLILFTLPPDSYKNGVPNADVAKVGAEIAAYAKAHGHVCWDLQTVMGGQGSMSKWRSGGIAGKDMVHFSAPGYRLQGQLFFEALMRAYKHYAENRP